MIRIFAPYFYQLILRILIFTCLTSFHLNLSDYQTPHNFSSFKFFKVLRLKHLNKINKYQKDLLLVKTSRNDR